MPRLQRAGEKYFLAGRPLEAGDVMFLATGGNYHGIALTDPLPVTVTFDSGGSLRLKTCAPLGPGERQVDIPFSPEEDIFSWP
jgi:hypothetical protein